MFSKKRVFGGFVENIDRLDQYKIVLSIRDPRDILVSDYYSKAFSHPVPPENSGKTDKFLEERRQAQSITIDEFALINSDKILNIYRKYTQNLLDRKNVGALKYELMINDYSLFLDKLAFHSGLELPSKLKNALINKFELNKVKKEDKNKHNRKGIAGDYKQKLENSTIEKLNLTFKDILQTYGYS